MDKKDIAITLLKEKITQGELCKLRIRSRWSMYPLFEKQGALKIRSVLIKDLCLGDIVVYKKDQDLIAHRYIRITKTQSGKAIITKGDSAASFDPYVVLEEELLGKVISFTAADKTISYENVFWRSINALLAKLSLWEASCYILAARSSSSKNPASACLINILIFARKAGEGVRIILIRLLVLWSRIVF